MRLIFILTPACLFGSIAAIITQSAIAGLIIAALVACVGFSATQAHQERDEIA